MEAGWLSYWWLTYWWLLVRTGPAGPDGASTRGPWAKTRDQREPAVQALDLVGTAATWPREMQGCLSDKSRSDKSRSPQCQTCPKERVCLHWVHDWLNPSVRWSGAGGPKRRRLKAELKNNFFIVGLFRQSKPGRNKTIQNKTEQRIQKH